MKSLNGTSTLRSLRRIAMILVLSGLLGFMFAAPARGASMPPYGWSPLARGGLMGSNLPGKVNAIAFVGDDMYVGGVFTNTAQLTPGGIVNIGRYNTVTKTWSALSHGGLLGDLWLYGVTGLTTVGTDLYAVGNFYRTADLQIYLGTIAKYNTLTNTWSVLPPGGPAGGARAIQSFGNKLYVGGDISQGGVVHEMYGMAVFDLQTNQWSTMPNTIFGYGDAVQAFVLSGNTLYVGGRFHKYADDKVSEVFHIAKFDLTTNTWSAFPNGGLNGRVTSLVERNGVLFVGGEFDKTADGKVTGLRGVARFNIAANKWSALPNGGVDGKVNGLLIVNNVLYVGGIFFGTADGKVAMRNIGRFYFKTNNWSSLTHGGIYKGNAAVVNTLAFYGDALYIGGQFAKTADSAITFSSIAKYSLLDAQAPHVYLSNSGTDGSGHKFIEMTARDVDSGVAGIAVLRSDNANTVISPFVPGTNDPIIIRATKIDPTKNSKTRIWVTDIAGNAAAGDPALQLLTIVKGKRIAQTFKNIPAQGHLIHVANASSGLTQLRIVVNGKVFEVVKLSPGESRTIDVASAMQADANTIKLVGKGKVGESAFVIIGDSAMDASSLVKGFLRDQKESAQENFGWGN